MLGLAQPGTAMVYAEIVALADRHQLPLPGAMLGEVRGLDPLGDLEMAIRRKGGDFCMLHTLLTFLHAKFKGYWKD